ncbi:phosphoribosylformylglycinamidine cyclo-ligase (phosphoribosyl-aminoimidazole synthetase) (AIR synthase) [Chondrus crispus]|uniref:phosphoribosylformylglycinamidine cyclo-ligase n=1 Tax=Chondrus crispus TaxID=2769 RepID=R7QRW7_CHOCR|nr:phosphoribosylformylglycinamidine cyclo-ligase (phosphoribosyl-aminoimidazole synthetase) (AIR synthase) [Chondrus crispus]CDF40105.1 phosphoribosylformylglycinamidine cyclo-ligase (phosphoribosyl-aminoimidazole synthetase) (AIR synthase) [Chondrus crispus]|eukprot:XP_005710399.1 phosphoribosylformylglycinamidine cyclo-ligase (phosphoribosyl-aminoimidazole synthetase) (AIR synthase) [Chondrus crispus]
MSAATPPDKPLSYASSGVDIDRESSSVAALIGALGRGASSRPAGTLGALVDHAGGFSGLIEFGDRLLALCTDGVGSKLLLAAELRYYETVAIDCMAMNVNDLLCIGAEPLAFVDYIAAPAPAPDTWAAIGRSLATACELARVSLCGGETATLPDMVTELDLSGTALGWLPRGAQLDGSAIRAGDVLVGLPASGVHSNGYSLVRKVVQKAGMSLREAAPFEVGSERAGEVWRHGDGAVTLGEVLLNPTRIYVDPVVDLLLACRKGDGPCAYEDVHGIAHVTGGGLSNLLRLKKGAGFYVDAPLPVLPEFEWLQAAGALSDYEMHRTFNMGMGLCIIVAPHAGAAVCEWLAARLPGSRAVGAVNDSGVVTHAIDSVRFDTY